MGVSVMIGAVLGALCLIISFFVSSAPQEAALAATACAFAVIPYVGFRASQIAQADKERRKFQEDVIERLRALEQSRRD